MSARAAHRLAGASWALAVALTLASAVLPLLGGSGSTDSGGPLFDVVLAIGLLSFPTVGMVVAGRRPENPIGQLFCAVGVPFALTSACYAWVVYAAPRGLPGVDVGAWLNGWLLLPPLFGVPALLFLLFPDGRVLSPRWRVVVWMTGVAMAGFGAAPALRPGPLEDSPVDGVENPLGIPGAAGVLDVVGAISGVLAVLAIVLGGVALGIRLRRSRGVERLQLKWFLTAAALFAVACLAFLSVHGGPFETAAQVGVLAAFALIPVSAGVAILRYRLYDIDVVINRALVYGALTLTLGAAYLAGVLLVGLAVGRSGFAVAVSTLAVAALFRPLRARIQAVVDRRFYRRRYDASRTLEAFGGRLREELDLETLTADIRAVVHDTVQPAHVSVWLR
jgi:hypothetical protein